MRLLRIPGGLVIRRLLLTGIVAALLLAGFFYLPTLSRGVAAAPIPSSGPQNTQGVSDIVPHQAEGSKTAPVIMEVFSDYQCPACKQLFTTTDRMIVDNYVNTGKVYLIHRDSRVAARYPRAAAQIGKFGPAQQALFANQEKWEANGDVDGTVASALTAAEMVKVRALVKGGTLDALIDTDFG